MKQSEKTITNELSIAKDKSVLQEISKILDAGVHDDVIQRAEEQNSFLEKFSEEVNKTENDDVNKSTEEYLQGNLVVQNPSHPNEYLV